MMSPSSCRRALAKGRANLRSLLGVAAVAIAAVSSVSATAGCATSEGGANCAAGPACESQGWCSWDASSGRCAALRDKDCQNSAVCEDAGACAAMNGECERPDKTCATSPGCQREGLCHSEGSLCVALDDRDCSKSLACRSEQRCSMVRGRCQKASVALVPNLKPAVTGFDALPLVCQRLVDCMVQITGQGNNAPSRPELVKLLVQALKVKSGPKLEEMCASAMKGMPSSGVCP